MRSLYEILNVPAHATQDELRRGYLSMALKASPR